MPEGDPVARRLHSAYMDHDGWKDDLMSALSEKLPSWRRLAHLRPSDIDDLRELAVDPAVRDEIVRRLGRLMQEMQARQPADMDTLYSIGRQIHAAFPSGTDLDIVDPLEAVFVRAGFEGDSFDHAYELYEQALKMSGRGGSYSAASGATGHRVA
ncbi:hypothetical protein LGR54_19705 [Ancylobacter sp. Lp-2]|uniref:hypothetical protein n=1 Tax=Ancylobacter sp. Lp-2 TaxID=2881339 RepID=UPI001E2F7FDF|nr:hypothetical protein [Ancylobacter sp. Lp-2]MCB4770842.1 hypothetical protein [Ancylobacter sp. Lp-2]